MTYCKKISFRQNRIFSLASSKENQIVTGKHILFISILLAAANLVDSSANADSTSSAIPIWNRWEYSLTSSKNYGNPCNDAVLRVIYNGPEGQEIRGYGFWDGGAAFKIRCMFPATGQWRWRTECSDLENHGLHNRQGVVEVTPYAGANLLYRKGYLQLSDNHRYLTFGDGTPFLWIGDTAWAAPMRATMEEWKKYLNDRREKRFSVLQIFCSTQSWTGDKANRNGRIPFVEAGVAKWNPAYWQDYEEMVQQANERGFIPMIVGLMEPVDRYPKTEEAQIFTRNLVARLMGNFVIFSPSFDSPYNELGDAVGKTIRETTPLHLITQHPGTDLPAAKNYYDKVYLDFCGLQSGAGWGADPISPDIAARNAVEWTLDLYRRAPWKPVINLETRYDSGFNQKQLPRMPRSCGYWTLLSGAKGYTYGCAGIWFWGKPIATQDPQADASWDLAAGMQQPSSLHMKYMADFFNGLEWWRLEPAHEIILNQPEKPTERMVLAATPEKDLAAAYLPSNEQIKIQMAAFPRAMQFRWFNPQTGQYSDPKESAPNIGEQGFKRPGGWEDALLVLSQKKE